MLSPTDDLVVVPDEQRAFRDLEVRALHTLRDAREELHGNSFELRRLNVLQDLLDLVDEQDLLGSRRDSPNAEQPVQDRFTCGLRICNS